MGGVVAVHYRELLCELRGGDVASREGGRFGYNMEVGWDSDWEVG